MTVICVALKKPRTDITPRHLRHAKGHVVAAVRDHLAEFIETQCLVMNFPPLRLHLCIDQPPRRVNEVAAGGHVRDRALRVDHPL